MQKIIKSDERLVEILWELKQDGELGVTELADRTGLSKSTVHAHLQTLVKHQYVVRTDGRYRISLRFLDYGTAARNACPIYQDGQRKAEELARETGEQVWCIVEEWGEAVYLCGADGSHAIQTDAHVGQRVELAYLSGGRAILANLPEDRKEEIIAGYDFDIEEVPFQSEEELRAELETVLENGVSLNTEIYVKAVNAIGAPIIDNNGRVYGALSIVGPAKRMDNEKLTGELTDLLLSATNELGVNLTYT